MFPNVKYDTLISVIQMPTVKFNIIWAMWYRNAVIPHTQI